MVRKRPTLFSLKRGELRQSWNKFNLYNLSRFRSPTRPADNFFKQKWTAKAKTRKYHGEQVREKQWNRTFIPTPRAVIPMDPAYLAQSDGSVESAGRGSGRDAVSEERGKRKSIIPYMNMTFAPLERRLDVAIHRALFAASIRQARQFCVHGDVKVNGVKMIHPSYKLNPGDMFSVEPDRVLYATGQSKGHLERRETRKLKKAQDPGAEEGEASQEATKSAVQATEQTPEDAKKTLKKLLATTKDLLEAEKTTASAKRKQDLRAFQKLVRSAIPQGGNDEIETLMEKLNIQVEAEPEKDAQNAAPATEAGESSERNTLTPRQKRDLEKALQELRENPIDPSKPYATPWKPRDFMSAFAFVPRYLEVHHKVCSAVYLRHPVARPGLAEVPTPFDLEMNGLAFNWYLRRR